MAKPPKTSLIVFPFPIQGWDTNWARHDQPGLTSPDLQNCMAYDLDRRARGAKRAGFSILTGAAVGTVAATYRQARECVNDNLVNAWVPTSEISSYPYNFRVVDSDVCMYVAEADPASETPGAIVPANQRVTTTGCDDDDCSEVYPPSPPPPAAVLYRSLRICPTPLNIPNEIVLASEFPTLPAYFRVNATGECRSVVEGDITYMISGTPNPALYNVTAAAATTAVDDCYDSDCGTATGNYYQLKTCDTDTPTDFFVPESAVPNAAGAATADTFFLLYDRTCIPLWVETGDTDSSAPISIYTSPDGALPINQCDGGIQDWFFDSTTFPATRDITFASVVMRATALDTGCTWYAVTGGALNGTYTLNQTGGAASATYELAIGGITVTEYQADGTTVKATSTSVLIELEYQAGTPRAGGLMCDYEIVVRVTCTGLDYTIVLFDSNAAGDDNPIEDTYAVSNAYSAHAGGSCGVPDPVLGAGGTATAEGIYA